MRKRIAALLLAALVWLLPVTVQAAPREDPPFTLDAAAALLMDASTGEVIFEQNAKEKRPVASVTKLMTILLTLEALEEGKAALTDTVQVSKRAAGMGGSQALLDADSGYVLEELLKSLIVASANDSAVALAEHLMGSEENFVEAMNRRAQQLGLTDTAYRNATGLPVEGQYTTAQDVAQLSRQLLSHEQFFKYSTIWMDEIKHKNGRVTQLVNTNRLIRFYEGADGVKTGSTNEALFCVSASAKRGDLRFIAVVLGAPSGKVRFDLAGKMLSYGFDHYQRMTLLGTEQPVVTDLPVKGAARQTAEVYVQSPLAVLIKKGEEGRYSLEYSLPETVAAPQRAGEVVGEAILLKDGEAVDRVPLVLREALEPSGYLYSLSKILGGWLADG